MATKPELANTNLRLLVSDSTIYNRIGGLWSWEFSALAAWYVVDGDQSVKNYEVALKFFRALRAKGAIE
jgi:hypothetical protein